MKRAAMGLLLACLAAGCSNNAPGTSVTQGTTTGAGMEIQFRSEADPPASGDNTFEVIVAKDGVRVDDAQVNAAFSMPAMPSMNMPEMHSQRDVGVSWRWQVPRNGPAVDGGYVERPNNRHAERSGARNQDVEHRRQVVTACLHWTSVRRSDWPIRRNASWYAGASLSGTIVR